MKKFAVIIPYRNREKHLEALIPALTKNLNKLDIIYDILVVEQSSEKQFNKGALLNVGFKLIEESGYDYFCFHDVDMIPTDNVNYTYVENITHIATLVSQFGYRMPYPTYFGGVILLTPEEYKKTNGYSNQYWGWGAEDDDFFERIKHFNIQYKRRSCKFDSINHPRDIYHENYNNNVMLLEKNKKQPEKYSIDGLSDIVYDVVSVDNNKLYSKYLVRI